MAKPEAPKPPSPERTAGAQTASNVETALAEAQLNRVNETTPYGSVSYTASPGSTTIGGQNIPDYTRTVTESENQRRLREGQEGLGIALGDLAQEQTGRVGDLLSKPYEAQRFNLADALGDYGSDVEKRTYELATGNLGREFDRAEEGLRSRLANQGITQGSDAFGAELESFNRSKGQAYTDATLQARNVAEASRGQNLAELLQEYGINTSADLAERQVPISEITSIMSGTPITPINPGSIATSGIGNTDVAGIYQNDFQNRANTYNQKMAQQNAIMGSLFGLGGAYAGTL